MRVLVGALFIVLTLTGVACEKLDDGETGASNKAQLSQEATITPDQAQTAALAAVPGTVVGARLERAAGKVFYDFDVQPAKGGKLTEVRVDATTGKVLTTEATGTPDTKEGD